MKIRTLPKYFLKHVLFTFKVQLDGASEPNRTVQHRNNHSSSALKQSASLTRPVSMPPSDAPSLPVAGVVSSPPHPGVFGRFAPF